MKRNIFVISIIAFAGLIVLGSYVFRSYRDSQKSDMNVNQDEKRLQVVATFYPLGEFARQVGGEYADVSIIVPSGIEPHDYEPTPQDIAAVYSADVFIINGGGVDAWAERISSEVESRGVRVLKMSDVFNAQAIVSDEHDEDEAEDEGGIDPHFWLDPVLAQDEVKQIGEAFALADAKHRDVYIQNAMNYGERLSVLDKQYSEELSSCRVNAIITSHGAFGYTAKRYGFEQFSIAGISPENEPSTRQLADLSLLAKQKNIRYIFFESLVSPRLAQTLADEVGAETIVFNPLEGLSNEEMERGDNYISVMEENLRNIRTAMECQ